MVRFFQIQQTNQTKWRLPFAIRFPVIVFGWWETGNWKLKQMVRKFPPFRSERKKRSTSEGTPQFPNRISGKLPYHLSSNRNFWSFWPNGTHPSFPCNMQRPHFSTCLGMFYCETGIFSLIRGTQQIVITDHERMKIVVFACFPI